MWEVSGGKILAIDRSMDRAEGAPVHTVAGRYQPRGWTDWTQGFEFGSAVLQFDATGDKQFLDMALARIRAEMPAHVTHFGVHDHGFNQISTYGNLRRLVGEGRIAHDPWQMEYFELALKCSGAVQAHRWTDLGEGFGYIQSFNGPHSLFIDTMRTLRVLALAHKLGHVMKGEGDVIIPLLGRLIAHARTTAKYSIFYGEGRDIYDVRGRTAHEAIFNVTNGAFRCVGTQQGYSGYSTWTRGLSWAMCGFAELLEFIETRPQAEFVPYGGKAEIVGIMERAAAATCDFFIDAHRRRRHPLLGYGRARLARSRRPLRSPVGTGERFRAGRQLCGGDRRARIAALWRLAAGQGTRRRALSSGRLDGAEDAACRIAISVAMPIIKGWCCTASIIAPTAGTMCRRAARYPVARPPCGATTTCASSPFTCSGWPSRVTI